MLETKVSRWFKYFLFVLICFIVCIISTHNKTLFPKNARPYAYTSRVPWQHKHHRVVVFASFSSTGKIPEYVVYYLKELKKVSDAIIFVSDNPIFIEETEKIKDLVYYMEFKRHEEYDFGSYKRGLLFLRYNKLLDSEDSLVLANDSCYGGVYPFAPVFKKMNNYKNVDFGVWHLIMNIDIICNLISWFFLPRYYQVMI